MKKDKKWAQKEVDKYLSYEGVNEARSALIFAKGVIDQLDEPEVLSQEWIERNTSPVDDEGRLYVWERDLQNAIVPKPSEKKEIDNTMWINYGYHCQEVAKIKQENKELRQIVLEMNLENIELEKENNKLKDVYTNLADVVNSIEEEKLTEAVNLEYPS